MVNLNAVDGGFRVLTDERTAVTAAARFDIIAKMRAWKPSGAFALGGLGPLINVAALIYGVFGIWPLCTKGGAFNPTGSFVDRNLVIVSIVGVTVVGLVYLLAANPTRHETVAARRAD